MTIRVDQMTPVTIRRMLVPLDGSRLAEVTLPLSVAIAAAAGAALTLLHVLERHPPPMVHGEPHLRDLTTSEDYLRALAARWGRSGMTIANHVHPNPQADVARSIVEHADELNADLIALATHGSGGIRGFLFGSIAQQVLRQGRRPVLLVRPRAGSRLAVAETRLRVIIVPLDGTSDAERALPMAMALAKATGARLHLVRIVPTVGHVHGPASAAAMLTPSATAALLDLEYQAARDDLQALAQQLTAIGDVAVEVRRGDVLDELEHVVGERGADLIVISTHGHRGIEGFLTGSLGARLLGKLEQPVLLVRHGDPASKAPGS
ncbi:MAG: universal stress protein [Thermomicrobiales bacterium]